jgi:EAL domain-containing protein (putative c-di-GMP-specific phosphodiesterase class I)
LCSERRSAPSCTTITDRPCATTSCSSRAIRARSSSIARAEDPETASLILARLGEHGVQVAIDDFGTGFSSLAHLRRLPVNYLKVDRSFVAELEDGHTAVVSTVITLAHNLGMDVIAEGVETAQQMQRLEDMRCSLLQGFGISRPLTDQDFVDWCRSWYPMSLEGAT